MNILMMTNTFTPIVGGLEKSVQDFSDEFRKRGHRVLIATPSCKGMPKSENGVLRLPAFQSAKSDFPIHLAVPGVLTDALKDFPVDLVHAHHPFLIGDTALRVAHQFKAPLVYTYHTLFERNAEFILGDNEAFTRFVVELAAGYANLSDHVFAPSRGVQQILKKQGVSSPISVVPSGLDLELFTRGDGTKFRKKFKIPENAFVAGYAGRLAPEKNLEFLARAAALFLEKRPDAVFLCVGKGPLEQAIRDTFKEKGLSKRLFMPGVLRGESLSAAYHAMDVFAFSSQSETQGLVLIEAMAAGVPVVALDACGVHDAVRNERNGLLLKRADEKAFAEGLERFAALPKSERLLFMRRARQTAAKYSKTSCAERALKVYESLVGRRREHSPEQQGVWAQALRQASAEWKLVKNMTKAAGSMIRHAA